MPLSEKQVKELFGHFAFREDPKRKGAILIDSRWVALNIVTIPNPLKPGSKLSCHKKVAYQMERFLAEGVKAGLIQTIDGIFVARHKMWDPARSLSGHSWGVEVDVNAQIGKDGKGGTWNYGANSYQPPALIELAKKWGMEWGGSWRHPDGMHFSVVKVIEPGGVKPVPKPPAIEKKRILQPVTRERFADALFSKKLPAIFMGPKLNPSGAITRGEAKILVERALEHKNITIPDVFKDGRFEDNLMENELPFVLERLGWRSPPE